MTIYSATIARFNFEYALQDVALLLKHHDSLHGGAPGRPRRELEVFKRSAVILTVTAWESYIEHTFRTEFGKHLEAATSPAELESAFSAAADQWLQSKDARRPRELSRWTGEGWKSVVRSRFEDEVASLNTPDSKRVQKLSTRYLGVDVVKSWVWQRTSSGSAAERLDKLIALRGKLVHRGRELFNLQESVRRSDVVSGSRLVRKLVECTDKSLGIAPTEYPIPDPLG